MEPNQLKKIVIPALAVTAIILLVGGLFLIGEPGSTGSGDPKPNPTGPKGPPGDTSMDGMSDSLPDANAAEFKDIGGGLMVWDVKVGDGAECKPGAEVTIHYTGWLLSGKVFDTTKKGGGIPAHFFLGRLIAGWQKGIPGMKAGGIRRLKIPPELGYGVGGFPPDIPANATLLFEIKLLDSH